MASNHIPTGRLTPLLARLRAGVFADAGWVVGLFGYQQVLRLAQNVVLARLLSPAVFGLMSIITALRIGIELLTDFGVGQSIVVAEQGETRSFINTAWTIQAIRGVAMTLIATAIAWPIALWYEQPLLAPVLAAMSLLSLIGGFNYPARALMQRRRMVKKIAIFESAMTTAGTLIILVICYLFPSIWGLVVGILLGSIIVLIASFFIIPIEAVRLSISKADAATIRSFGKWVYVSSVVFFIAGNFDRLFLPTQISLTLLGIYGIARTLADAASLLFQRLSQMIIFPTVARLGDRLMEQIDRIRMLRRRVLFATSVGLAALTATSDVFVELCYDDRYLPATLLAPILLVGTWFSIQAYTCEAVLLGLSQPNRTAGASIVKLLWMVVILPVAFYLGGLLTGLVVIAVNDLPRYLWLAYYQRRAGLRFFWQDAASLVIFLVGIVALRWALAAIGVVPAMITAVQLAALKSF